MERIVSSFDDWSRDGSWPVLVGMDTVSRRGLFGWLARWMAVHMLCFDWIYVWLEGCVTGLPEFWPGGGYHLAGGCV